MTVPPMPIRRKELLLVSSSSRSCHFLSCARIFCSPTSGPAAGPRHPHGIFFPLSGCISRIVFLICCRGVACSSSSGTPGMFSSGCGIL